MSTYAQRVQLGPFFDGGALQGGVKLYHYAVGSSTLKDIYLDRAKGTTLAQPFVADADGILNFFADGLYKLIIVGPDSTGPAVDVLYTLDDWQLLDAEGDVTWDEETAVASASTIAIGPGIWQHVTGSTTIGTITMTTPFAWLVFDGNLTLTYSASLLTPAGIDLAVRANDVLFLLNEGSGVVRIAGHSHYDGVVIATQDSRTATADVALTVRSTTSGAPAAGIATGILLQAESADEAISDVGQVEAGFSDVGAGTEDSYVQMLLRVAGAALTACWRFAAAAAFKGILTHTNTADRTYTFPNASYAIDAGECYKGPSSCGSGSTRSHEGTVTVASNGNYSGIHFYDDFTLNSGVTMTVPAGKRRLIIVAKGTITINGTITAAGAGAPGGSGNPTTDADGNWYLPSTGQPGTDQPGGGATAASGSALPGGAGGPVMVQGAIVQYGGLMNTAGVQVAGSDHPLIVALLLAMGGAGGGGTAQTGVGSLTGGAGGGSIVLIAPAVVLAATATLNTSGANGATDGADEHAGGGGAGNVYVATRSYTDNGCTFTQTGGTGSGTAGDGAAGVKQINIYA